MLRAFPLTLVVALAAAAPLAAHPAAPLAAHPAAPRGMDDHARPAEEAAPAPAAPARARDTVPEAAVLRQARESADALVRKDYAAYTRTVHPRVVAGVGGRAAMIAAMEASMEKDGWSIQSVRMQPPIQVDSARGRLLAVLPMTLVMRVRGGTLESRSWLLGVSEDGGARWTFVDGAGFEGSAGPLFPDDPGLRGRLRPPARTPPVFTPSP